MAKKGTSGPSPDQPSVDAPERDHWLMSWLTRLRSRLTLFVVWWVPMLVYLLLLIILPVWKSPYISSVQIGPCLITLGQVFIPVSMVFVYFYFPEHEGVGSLKRLTAQRFWVAFSIILVYQVIIGVYFLVHIVCADYSLTQTHFETLEGRLDEFTKCALYLSLLVMYPIKWVFSRETEKRR